MEKFDLNPCDTVLLIVDIQERLAPVMKYGKDVIKNTNILAAIAKELDLPVIVTEQYPKGLGKTVSELAHVLEWALVYEKTSFTAYTDEVALALKESGRKNVVLVGMETHVCVYQTVRDLITHGFRVHLAKDAVCSRTKENFKNGVSLMSQMGAVVTNTETILFDLLKVAGTPEFKRLSKLIK